MATIGVPYRVGEVVIERFSIEDSSSRIEVLAYEEQLAICDNSLKVTPIGGGRVRFATPDGRAVHETVPEGSYLLGNRKMQRV